MKMMDVRDRIVKLLDQNSGKRFSVEEVAREIGSNAKATTAALGRLYKQGRVDRPQKGVYISKTQRGVQKTAKIEKVAPEPAAGPAAMAVVSIDLLVAGDASQVDVSRLRQFALGDPNVLDFKVRKTLPADRSKLKVSFALPESE